MCVKHGRAAGLLSIGTSRVRVRVRVRQRQRRRLRRRQRLRRSALGVRGSAFGCAAGGLSRSCRIVVIHRAWTLDLRSTVNRHWHVRSGHAACADSSARGRGAPGCCTRPTPYWKFLASNDRRAGPRLMWAACARCTAGPSGCSGSSGVRDGPYHSVPGHHLRVLQSVLPRVLAGRISYPPQRTATRLLRWRRAIATRVAGARAATWWCRADGPRARRACGDRAVGAGPRGARDDSPIAAPRQRHRRHAASVINSSAYFVRERSLVLAG